MHPLLSAMLVAAAMGAQVDQKKVDAAVEKGCGWLLKQKDVPDTWTMFGKFDESALELVVLTLAHSGYTESHPGVRAWVEAMLKGKYDSTYRVALRAMAFQKLDARRYQGHIARCAQFLADNRA